MIPRVFVNHSVEYLLDLGELLLAAIKSTAVLPAATAQPQLLCHASFRTAQPHPLPEVWYILIIDSSESTIAFM